MKNLLTVAALILLTPHVSVGDHYSPGDLDKYFPYPSDDYGYAGSLQLSANGDYKSQFQYGLNVDLKLDALATTTFTYDAPGAETEYSATGTYRADGFLKTDGHKVRALLQGNVVSSGDIEGWLELASGGFPPRVSTSAGLYSRNQFLLMYTGDGEVPIIPGEINAIYGVDATLQGKFESATPFSSSIWQANANLETRIGIDLYSYNVGKNDVFSDMFDDQTLTVDAKYSSRLQLFSHGDEKVRTSEIWTLGVTIGGGSTWGSHAARVENTVELESLVFDDGTTPEDHGFEVIFANGLHSPNSSTVSSVPEPTALAIWSVLGCLGLVVAHRPRKPRATWLSKLSALGLIETLSWGVIPTFIVGMPFWTRVHPSAKMPDHI